MPKRDQITTPSGSHIMLNVRTEEVREKADRLAEALTKVKGVRVIRADAVDIAITEALAKYQKKAENV